MAKKSKRRKGAPLFPPRASKPVAISAKKANTLRRRAVISSICERTRLARAQRDAFTAGIDMSDLADYPVMVKLDVPKVVRVKVPKERIVNDARMSTAVRKPSPVRTRQNRCNHCGELGHNSKGCAKRKEFESALRHAA